MAHRRRQIPGDLAETREKIEDWRRTRAKRGAMPEALWAEAEALAVRHGMWFVSRVLRLNYERLKARVGRQVEKPSAPKGAGPPSGLPRFVELEIPPVAASGPSGVVVELSSADGARLVIRAPGVEGLDVSGLVTAFWRRGA